MTFFLLQLKHNLQWEGNIRDIDVLTKTTSFDVRKECGPNLKSAFKHILSVDLRDDPIFPNAGSLFQLTSELAGAGGNVGFLKNDFFLQSNYSFGADFVVQACLNGGYLSPLSKDKKISIADMYYLGGPLSIRGFEARGIGPRSNGDALGATTFWSGGLHLYTPVPFRGNKGSIGDLFRLHYFINVGNISNLKFGKYGCLFNLYNNATSVRIFDYSPSLHGIWKQHYISILFSKNSVFLCDFSICIQVVSFIMW